MMLLSSLLSTLHLCNSCDSPLVVRVSGVSPTVGKLLDIIPILMHASLLRNSLSVLLLMYLS